MIRQSLYLLFIFTLGLLICGCARLVVTSEPEGARIFYAREFENAMPRWEPLGRTPIHKWSWHWRAFFLKAEKDGYYPSEPKLLETFSLKKERVHFKLEERPEHFARIQREKGLVLYQGKWVRPEEKGLVLYKGKWMKKDEAFAQKQREKGLVLFNGRWMTPEEKEKRLSEINRQRGLVLYKGRWMKKEEFGRQKRIDETVEEVCESTQTLSLPPPRVAGVINSERAKLRLFNASGNEVIFFISGRYSFMVPVKAYDSEVLMLPPDKYKVGVVPRPERDLMERVQPPALGEARLNGGFQYSITYEGVSVELPVRSSNVEEYIRQRFTLPEISIPEVKKPSHRPSKKIPPPLRGKRSSH